MLRIRFVRVSPDDVGRLLGWMEELERRRDEVVETFAQETVRHEMAWLIEDREGPLLVYAVEAEDLARADEAVRHSTLAIDLEHRRVMDDILGERLEVEPILDIRR